MTDTPIYSAIVESPVGFWLISATDEAIISIKFTRSHPSGTLKGNNITAKATYQLAEYFRSERNTFDLPLNMSSYSFFYQSVWRSLCKILYGKAISYTELARRIENPLAVRAVGMANAKNPFPIVVPCHRVIGKNQKLVGYAGGLDVKRWLLEHEGVLAAQPSLF